MAYRIFISLIVLACAYFAFETVRFKMLEHSLLNTEAEYILGNPDGDVTFVMFFDYSCDLCRESDPIIQQAINKDGQVKYLARPVSVLKKEGFNAAILPYAAAKQGKFAEMHNAVMANYRVIDDQTLQDLALTAGIEPTQFISDFKDEDTIQPVFDNMDIYDGYRLKYVPTFAVNGQIVFTPQGILSVNDYLNLFNEARGQ